MKTLGALLLVLAAVGGSTVGCGSEDGDETTERRPLASGCTVVDSFGNSTVTTSCSFDATCKALGCGESFSLFDAGGCLRAACASSADCAIGERCVPSILRDECRSTHVDFCVRSDGACACQAPLDCQVVSFCESAEKFPPSEDCDFTGASCNHLLGLAGLISGLRYEGDTAEAIDACRVKASEAFVACDG